MRTVEGRTDRVAIVGAGLSGLSAALQLAGRGRAVTVIERGDHPGGRVGRADVSGYRLDTGPTVLTMPDIIDDAFAAVGESLSDRVELQPVHPAYQAMFADELPDFARARTARVAAGLGAIARVVSEGQEIYARKLTFEEARGRIENVHAPYHAALARLLGEAHAAHGYAILVDWHSMPAAAARVGGRGGCDMVLGDRFGAACAPLVTQTVERELEAFGYQVARNAPYAGGYTTEHYGRPGRRTHALQIEINRALYLNEMSLQPTAGFAKLKANLEAVIATLGRTDWSGLRA